MSIRAMNWAWGQKLPPTPKLILMALADSANDLDECWPGIAFIADKCNVSERTVQRVLQQFVNTGLMMVTPRYTTAGRQTSNGYRLRLDSLVSPDKLSPLPSAVEDKGDKLSGTGVTPKESEQQPLHFPRQLSPAEKHAVQSLLYDVNSSNAQALLDELADALEYKTIKTNPLRWFHALVGKQKSGTFFPVGGVRIAERRRSIEKEREIAKAATPPPHQTIDRNIAREALAQVRRTMGVRDSPRNGKSRN